MEKLTQSYGFLLGKVLQRMETRFREALIPFDIDARQYGVLLYIEEHPYTSQKMIGEQLKIDRTTMVNHVDHLEALGFVERTKNPNDRRTNSLVMTEEGNRVLASCETFLTKTELDVLDSLTKEEQQLFKELLLKVWRSL